MNNQKIFIIISIITIIVIIGIYIHKYIKTDKIYGLKIYFFNAGKADAILISNNNKYIMIDTGEESLSKEILNYFNNNNITKVDYLIITHFDKDHIGSASSIIENMEIDNVLQSNVPKESEYYENYINALSSKNITAQKVYGNKSFTIGDLSIIVNGPTEVYKDSESNNSSLIVSINYDNTSYLFTGDAENDRIKDYLKENNKTTYNFIKIPYHGNMQKQLDNLLETTEPDYAVITCSKEEPDTSETEELLEELNIKYYLTKNGSITVLSDGEEIVIKQ